MASELEEHDNNASPAVVAAWVEPSATGGCGPSCGCAGPQAVAAPAACSLSTQDRAERISRWQEVTRSARREFHDGGARLTYTAGIELQSLAALITEEQRCCPFFYYNLAIGKSTVLDITTPEHARELLTEMVGP